MEFGEESLSCIVIYISKWSEHCGLWLYWLICHLIFCMLNEAKDRSMFVSVLLRGSSLVGVGSFKSCRLDWFKLSTNLLLWVDESIDPQRVWCRMKSPPIITCSFSGWRLNISLRYRFVRDFMHIIATDGGVIIPQMLRGCWFKLVGFCDLLWRGVTHNSLW